MSDGYATNSQQVSTRVKSAARRRTLRVSSQRRQDLAFNSQHEEAESKMKENKTNLMRDKLQRNLLSVKVNRQGGDVVKVMQSNEVAMTAEYAVKQSAVTSDYATKAIASRLKMLAEKRKQIFNED